MFGTNLVALQVVTEGRSTPRRIASIARSMTAMSARRSHSIQSIGPLWQNEKAAQASAASVTVRQSRCRARSRSGRPGRGCRGGKVALDGVRSVGWRAAAVPTVPVQPIRIGRRVPIWRVSRVRKTLQHSR